MNLSATDQHQVPVTRSRDEPATAQWWEGVWFEGPMDPRGIGFAVALALAATIALVVVVAAAVRIVTGA